MSNVIVDNSKDDDEDDTFLVEEAAPTTHEVTPVRNTMFFNQCVVKYELITL